MKSTRPDTDSPLYYKGLLRSLSEGYITPLYVLGEQNFSNSWLGTNLKQKAASFLFTMLHIKTKKLANCAKRIPIMVLSNEEGEAFKTFKEAYDSKDRVRAIEFATSIDCVTIENINYGYVIVIY